MDWIWWNSHCFKISSHIIWNLINRLQIGRMRTSSIKMHSSHWVKGYSIAKYLIRYTTSYEACVARLRNQIMKLWVLCSLRTLFPDPCDNQQVVRCFWWNLQENYEDTSPSYALPESPPVGTYGIVPPYRPRQQFSPLWCLNAALCGLCCKPNQCYHCCVAHTYICFTCFSCRHIPHKWALGPCA